MTVSKNSDFSEKFGQSWPFRYDSFRMEQGYRPAGFRFSKCIVNLRVQLASHQVVVTGEADSHNLAFAKARSELLERSALVLFGLRYRADTSNGWAAHPDPEQARVNAAFELVERDAVLSQWYSATPFLELEPNEWPEEIRNWTSLELARSEFPKLRVLLSTRGIGPSVTCLFVNSSGLGVSAHATRGTLEESIRVAIAEACRPAHSSIRREHWEVTLKLRNGTGDSRASEPHALYYAYHEPFPNWIFGEVISWNHAMSIWQERVEKLNLANAPFEFVEVLAEPLTVGFAKHPSAFPLRWGNTDATWVASLAGARRLSIALDQINKNVHIVS